MAALATSAVAENFLGLTEGNPDLNGKTFKAADPVGVQPGVGDRADIYGLLDDANPDLFTARRVSDPDSGERPDIYGAFGDGLSLNY
jgi:hypothetical protein